MCEYVEGMKIQSLSDAETTEVKYLVIGTLPVGISPLTYNTVSGDQLHGTVHRDNKYTHFFM
jgi:hypothetical protein